MNSNLAILYFILVVALSVAYWLDVKKELREIEEENKKWAKEIIMNKNKEDL